MDFEAIIGSVDCRARADIGGAEQGLVSTRLALLSNRISLFKAVGGGWQPK